MSDILDAKSTATPPIEPPPVTPPGGAIANPITGTPPVTPPSESLIVPPAEQPKTTPPSVSPPPMPHRGTKRPGVGVVVAGLLLLLLTLPIAVFYISQQQSTTDVRSRAAETTPGPYDTPTPTTGGGGVCQDGTGTSDPDSWLICECGNLGCSSYNDTTPGGGGWGWVCNSNCRKVPRGTQPQGACTQVDNIRPGGQDYCSVVSINCPESCRGGNPPGNTPTPTRAPAPKCENITMYKEGVVFTDYATLKPNDTTNICVQAGVSTSGRIRINGASWTEITEKNANNEYCITFVVPDGTTHFLAESEIFLDGEWK